MYNYEICSQDLVFVFHMTQQDIIQSSYILENALITLQGWIMDFNRLNYISQHLYVAVPPPSVALLGDSALNKVT